MSADLQFNLVAIPPVVKSTATYTRTPAPAQSPYPLFSLPAPTSAPVSHTHRVAPGENLTRIVRDHLAARGGNPTNHAVYDGVAAVARANGLKNANLIHPGQSLDLSALNGAPQTIQSAEAPRLAPPLFRPEPPRAKVAPLVESTPLEAPVVPEPPKAAPTDALRDSGLTRSTAPVKVTAAAQPAPEPIRLASAALPAVREPRGASGGPGPEPSDAAMALQRVLNRTANALSVLKGLVNHDGHHHDDASPWAPILDGKARISSEYGMRKDPFNGERAFHGGIDLAVKRGTPITALKDGVVTFSGWKGGYGNTVIVAHEGGLETMYSHAARTHVNAGDTVKAGALLADVGSTGRSTGPHLHFEVRKDGEAVNPVPYLKSVPARADGGH